MLAKKKNHLSLIIENVVLLLLTSLTYLPNLVQATIYRDDWYYTLDRLLGGPMAFRTMFYIDRPARGYFFELYYLLFGVEPAPFHAASFIWRILMGMAALWLFHQLWPKRHSVALAMAALFVLYPGYTRWMEGYENQPKVVSLFLMVLSFALTLQAIKTSRLVPKMIFWAASIISGWGYILLIDFALGMEVFRYLCVFIWYNRQMSGAPLLRKAVTAIKNGLPGALVLGVFLFWRLFIFSNRRAETDIALQLSAVVRSPLETATLWLVNLIRSFINTAILAFGAPSFQDVFALGPSTALTGLLLAAAAGACLFAGGVLLQKIGEEPAELDPSCVPWQREAIILGIIGVIVGVLPVVLMNREAAFGWHSHYTLPGSLAAATLVVGLVGLIASRRARLAMVTAVVILAVINQYGASTQVVKEEQEISQFWHQVAWRSPSILKGTGLVVLYPTVDYGEDVDAVNGPANFIYYPDAAGPLPVRYPLAATKQYPWTVKEFLAGGHDFMEYRTHNGMVDYEYLLVMTQPTKNACVRVIDRELPWFSFNDDDIALILGQNSDPRHIDTEGVSPKLRESIFGPEPAHGWCYFYEKADLALQSKDYRQVIALGTEAAKQGLQPADPVEWMPFLQAYAVLGDAAELERIGEKMIETEFNRVQACGVLSKMQENGVVFTPQIQEYTARMICRVEKK